MANNINLASVYASLIDELYRKKTLTGDLNIDPALVRAGENAKTIYIPKVSASGLGDYSRSSGYPDGDASVTWESVACNYDRGIKFQVDVMDNQETGNIAFGRLAKTFIEDNVVPEGDAFVFSQLAQVTGIQKATAATYADGAALLTALITANSAMDEAEVSEEGRILYITPTLLNSVKALDTTKSREALDSFAKIVKVPQTRFYTAITLNSGTGENASFGYAKTATTGKDINFMIVQKDAVMKYDKHVVSKVISADDNQSADADIIKYRKYGLVNAYQNKVKGIYLSAKA